MDLYCILAVAVRTNKMEHYQERHAQNQLQSVPGNENPLDTLVEAIITFISDKLTTGGIKMNPNTSKCLVVPFLTLSSFLEFFSVNLIQVDLPEIFAAHSLHFNF